MGLATEEASPAPAPLVLAPLAPVAQHATRGPETPQNRTAHSQPALLRTPKGASEPTTQAAHPRTLLGPPA